MNTSGEVADLMAKEAIQMTESAVKLTALGVKNLAAIVMALANDDGKTEGMLECIIAFIALYILSRFFKGKIGNGDFDIAYIIYLSIGLAGLFYAFIVVRWCNKWKSY